MMTDDELDVLASELSHEAERYAEGSGIHKVYAGALEATVRLRRLRTVIRACPLGWSNGALLVHRRTTGGEIVDWLRDLLGEP